MELKRVSAKLKTEEVPKFKSVLKALKYTQSNLVVENLVFNEIENFVDVTFEVNTESFNLIVEKLALNKIHLEMFDKESSKIIEEVNQQIERGKNKNAFLGWKESPTEKKKITVDSLSSEGNYEELIKITRNVSASKEEIEKAALKIDTAIKNNLEKAYNPAIQDNYYAENGIKKLIEIASDSKLTLINKNDVRLKAGILAINVCLKHKEQNENLLLLCNNSQIENLVSITAAMRLAKLLNDNSYGKRKLVDLVVKELNLNWLSSIFDGVKHKFDEKEILDFNKMVKFVKEERNKN